MAGIHPRGRLKETFAGMIPALMVFIALAIPIDGFGYGQTPILIYIPSEEAPPSGSGGGGGGAQFASLGKSCEYVQCFPVLTCNNETKYCIYVPNSEQVSGNYTYLIEPEINITESSKSIIEVPETGRGDYLLLLILIIVAIPAVLLYSYRSQIKMKMQPNEKERREYIRKNGIRRRDYHG